MYILTYIYAVIQRITVGLNCTVGEHALGYINGGLPDFSHLTKVTESAVVGGPMVLLPIFFGGPVGTFVTGCHSRGHQEGNLRVGGNR